jgi:hypothetical protein
LLTDSRSGVARFDAPENEAFSSWSGPRVSVKAVLGDCFGASAGHQFVAAVERLRRGDAEQALVVTLGGNEQVGACRLAR